MCRHVPTCETTLSTSDTNHLKRILHVGMCQHIWTCRHVLICADMCWHVPTCDINLETSDSDHLDVIYMPACVSTCGHADMCWYVPTCANMWNHPQHLWYRPFEIYLECWHVSAHLDMLTCVDMSRHVPTCDINIDTSYSDHLDLIWMLACVSVCRHGDMCWYVPTCETTLSTSDTNHLKLILHAGMCQQIGTCRYVPICADMCWHVLTCADMWH